MAKNVSETILIDRFSSKTALLREATKNEFVSMNYQSFKDIFALKRDLPGHKFINNSKNHKKKFDYEHDLIPLLSDEDHRMAEAYGVWIEKKMLKSSTVF